MGGVAFHSLHLLLCSPAIPEDTLRRLLGEFDRIGSKESILPGALKAERLFGLKYAIDCSQQGIEVQDETHDDRLVGYTSPTSRVRVVASRFSIDWNVVLVEINQHYDRIEAALKLPTRSQVESGLLAAEQCRAESEATLVSRWAYLKHAVSPQGRGDLVAGACLLELSGGYSRYLAIDDRHRVQQDLARLHVALALHRVRNGGYPSSLDQLVPNELDELPEDPFKSEPYAYRLTENGFLLYSLGTNGIDDGGSAEEGVGYSPSPVFEGLEIDGRDNPAAAEATNDLLQRIPPGADDPSLRTPLRFEPWPWQE